MPFKRAKHNKANPYTVVSNVSLRDSGLSLAAKGLLAYMLMLPDDWEFSIDELSRHSASGTRATRTALNELERLGYVIRNHPKNDDGTFGKWLWTVIEAPQCQNVKVEPQCQNVKVEPQCQNVKVEPQCRFPQVDNPQVDNPQVDNVTQQSLCVESAEPSECIEDIGEPARSVSRSTRSAGERPSYQVREEEKPYQRPDVDEHGNPKPADELSEMLNQYLAYQGAIEDE